MSNCILAFPDRTLAGTLSTGSWNASFPLSNLAVKDLAKKARSTDALAASTKFDINLGASLKLRVVALVGHNLSINATVQIKISTVSDFSSTVYDSGAISAYPNYYDTTALDWGHPILTANKPSTADALAMRYPIFVVTPATVTGQYVRVLITDTGNTDGYVELARCFVAPGLQPDRNMLNGHQFYWEADTTVERSRGGTPFFDRMEGRKVMTFVLPDLTLEQGMGQYIEMDRYLNLDKELFYVDDPAATCMAIRLRSFMGTLKQLSALESPYLSRADKAYSVVESV
jgi:hypothetical protein